MKRKMILPAFAAALVLFSAAAAVAGARVGKEAPPHDSPMGPHFSFTHAQWESTLTELPTEIRNAIYADKELFLKEHTKASADSGKTILKIRDFSIEPLSDNLIRFRCTDSNGNASSIIVGLKTNQSQK